jgi:putative inorganic carbon (hco3(-)) transporter
MKPEKKQALKGRTVSPKTDPIFSLIVIVYSLLAILTPNMYAFDSNGPEFLALAVVNLLVFGYMWSRNSSGNETGDLSRFFLHPAGIAYSVFLLFCLLSLAKAINISEWIMQISKTFTVFISVFLLFRVLRKDHSYIILASKILTVVLLFDCLTVFYHIFQFIVKEIPGIRDIKSIYSNKNILTAAVFVKIPFALWLFTYKTGRTKWFAFATLSAAFLAVLFLSTRAFYLGTILLTIVYLAFSVINFFRFSENKAFPLAGQYLLSLAGAVIIYSLVQGFLYPKSADPFTFNAARRIGSITSDTASSGRVVTWKRTAILVKENPILGVGLGNWKVTELKYENPLKRDHTYMVQNHNDFIEMAAETGVAGGLAYLAIFVIPFFLLGRSMVRKKENPDLPYLFLSVAGLLCYGVDAFFNFPANRPEIQALFAIYLATAIACSLPAGTLPALSKPLMTLLRAALTLVLLAVIYLLYLNFTSLKFQRIAQEEILAGKLTTSSEIMVAGFPPVPDLSSVAEPIAVLKARYLINDGKYGEAIGLLEKDRSSPYDGRQEYFLAMAFDMMGLRDSMLVHLKKAYGLKPLFFKTVLNLTNFMVEQDSIADAKAYLDSYLSRVRTNNIGWLVRIDLAEKAGDTAEALTLADKALKFLPNDTLLIGKRNDLTNRLGLYH